MGLHIPLGILPFVLVAMFTKVKDQVVFDARGGEERLQPVVVVVQDGIELVIVASRARVGEPEECRCYGIGNVVQDLLAALQQLTRVALIRKVPVESGGDQGSGIIWI